jgi:NADH:ubiquinone reductase (H+-translocating)
MEPKHVVIVGGGYGGLRAVERLANDPGLRITLVDRNPYHYLQTEAYGYIAGRVDIHDITIDLANWCEGFSPRVAFLNEKALRFDAQTQTLQTETQTLAYDYLIIAVGAHTNFFEFIGGLREHSYGVKILQRAFAFRSMFETLVYEKVRETRRDAEEPLHIAIGGAGLSGVEIAAEMAEVIHHNYRTLGTNAQKIRISLIDAAPTILPGMSPYIIDKTRQRLESLGVDILTDAFIDHVESGAIHLKNGSVLPYRFMIFTGGIKANTLDTEGPCELNRLLQLQPDSCLNIGGMQNVFAVGDCVELKDAHGTILPPTAQTAEKSAEYVARSIKDDLQGKAPGAFHARIDGVFVALGGRYAVGELFGVIRVKGYTAYVLKKITTKGYYLGLKLRINTGFRKRTVSPL